MFAPLAPNWPATMAGAAPFLTLKVWEESQAVAVGAESGDQSRNVVRTGSDLDSEAEVAEVAEDLHEVAKEVDRSLVDLLAAYSRLGSAVGTAAPPSRRLDGELRWPPSKQLEAVVWREAATGCLEPPAAAWVLSVPHFLWLRLRRCCRRRSIRDRTGQRSPLPTAQRRQQRLRLCRPSGTSEIVGFQFRLRGRLGILQLPLRDRSVSLQPRSGRRSAGSHPVRMRCR